MTLSKKLVSQIRYLESPDIIVKSLVTVIHHTTVGLCTSNLPGVSLCTAWPVLTFHTLTASTDPVVKKSPFCSQAIHKIRPES